MGGYEQTPHGLKQAPHPLGGGRRIGRGGACVQHAEPLTKTQKKSIEPLVGDRISSAHPFCHPVPGLRYSSPRGPGATRAFARSPPAIIPAPSGRFGRVCKDSPWVSNKPPSPERGGRRIGRGGACALHAEPLYHVKKFNRAPCGRQNPMRPLSVTPSRGSSILFLEDRGLRGHSPAHPRL